MRVRKQIARPGGAKSPTARKAMALAKSKAYQDGAYAEATLRAYATDFANFEAWCAKHRGDKRVTQNADVGAAVRAARPGVFLSPALRMRPSKTWCAMPLAETDGRPNARRRHGPGRASRSHPRFDSA
jgi:hypothetical protein